MKTLKINTKKLVTQKNLTICLLWFGTLLSIAQCNIPNTGFNDWTTRDNTVHVYDYPYHWEESFVNLFRRLSYGTGFFYKYDETDANNNVLLLSRRYTNKNSGFIRFKCHSAPSKLKGRYKFSGSDDPAETDTLRVVAYFSKFQII